MLSACVPSRSRAGFDAAMETLVAALVAPTLSEQISRIVKTSYLEYLESEYPNAADRLEDLHQWSNLPYRMKEIGSCFWRR